VVAGEVAQAMIAKEIAALQNNEVSTVRATSQIVDVPITKKPVGTSWLFSYIVCSFVGFMTKTSFGELVGWMSLILIIFWVICRSIQSTDPDVSGKTIRQTCVSYSPGDVEEDFIDGNPIGFVADSCAGVYAGKEDW
jgi:hypothetical protein